MSSLPNNREKEWKDSIKKSMPKTFIDYSNKVRIAIDSQGTEYFIKDGSECDESFIVTRPDGIYCSVWKKYFKTRWVENTYQLRPIKK